MRNIFHFVIVAFLIAFVSGCGYKASPYWSNAESGANSSCGDKSWSLLLASSMDLMSYLSRSQRHNPDFSSTILEFASCNNGAESGANSSCGDKTGRFCEFAHNDENF